MTTYRQAWRMRLRPGGEAEYDRAHARIWPELTAWMRDGGVTRFVIYRDGREVFAFQERTTPFPDPETPPPPLMVRWWQLMEPLMITDLDGRPVRTLMHEVFSLHADAGAA